MIVIDTNIASVLLSAGHPDLALVTDWLKSSADHDIRTSVITRAEVCYGIAILPEGSRKRALSQHANAFFAAYEEHILPFGSEEADSYAQIVAMRRRLGRPIGILDAQIAAIAKVAGAIVATRDTDDFLDCGVAVVNPYVRASHA
ncbi:MAG: type II toxin-antitoxin system VapC family toxin [Propionibacteriaceae bacterium]|jgi:predicted nucleic acid-binding protein|nr:type II toxin-antitoxin system VapC family toxin [Propionibacteriaceae bacterium]